MSAFTSAKLVGTLRTSALWPTSALRAMSGPSDGLYLSNLAPHTFQNSLGAVDHQIKLDQRRCADPVDEKQNFTARLRRKVLEDRANEFLGNRIGGSQPYPASARLAMNTNPHFHFVVGQRKIGPPLRRHGTRQQRHAHRAHGPA